MDPAKEDLEPPISLASQAIPADWLTFVSLRLASPVPSEKKTQGDPKGSWPRGYLNTRAPSRRPKEMKSLLGLMGLSPLHISRPSLAVVLNLMNALDLDPDTLEEIHKQLHQINHSSPTSISALLSASPKKSDRRIMGHF